MKTKLLSESDIQALLCRDEGHFFDFKSKDIDGKSLQKIVVAFANADGGDVLIGVSDTIGRRRTPRLEGFDSPESANGLLQALFSLSSSIPLKYEFLHYSKSYVLRIIVEKSNQVHPTGDRKVFVRYGAQSMPMTDPQQILDLSYAKGASSFEDQVLTACVPEIIVDSPKTRTFLDGYSPKTDPLDYLTNQNLLEPTRWTPRVAGVLLFAENPSAHIPNKCGAKVVRYETREQDPERDHLASVDRLEGCLYELIRSTINKITEIMSQVAIWTPNGLGSASYPPEAI
jgi:ATP-dependent DNA helicase RecG